MTANQIVIIAIVVLASIIVIFGIYFLIVHLLNKKRDKKINTIFDPENLVEEESLLNVMDEKKNIESTTSNANQDKFISDQETTQFQATNTLTQEQKINPFGVDLTMRTKDNTKIEIKDSNDQNKFIS